MTVKADTIDTTGQAAYEQCGYCHEYDGNSVMTGFPKLAGQNRQYLEKQLYDFKSGKRTGTMTATAELLSPEAITEVITYFSQQQLRANDKVLEPGAFSRAARLYMKGDWKRDIDACASCHGVDGKGSATIPRLAGQHSEYLLQELRRFRNGERHNDPAGIMRAAVKKLKDSEIQELADFLGAGAEVQGQP